MTGAATTRGTLSSNIIDPNKAYGIDFNIAADSAGNPSLRLVSSSGENFAIRANTGMVGTIAFSGAITPNYGGVAYNNFPNSTGTGLYYIDFANDTLTFENDTFNAPAEVTIGSLGTDTIGAFGFDAVSPTMAFAGLTSGVTGQSGFYSINLATGEATLLGDFGANSPLFAGLTAYTAPVPEADTYAMMAAGLGLVGFAVARRRKQA